MATIKENSEEQGFFTVETPKKDVINVLGTQGLMYNDYSMPQHKVLMTIIKHGQTVIKQYIVPRKICHQSTILTPEQLAAGYVDVDIPMKDFGFSASNYTWLKGVLDNMSEQTSPFRSGRATSPSTCNGPAYSRRSTTRSLRDNGWPSFASKPR